MARRPEIFTLEVDSRTGIHYVRFRWGGRRFHESTGERDPEAARAAAERRYAEVVSGRRVAAVGPAPPLENLGSEWIANLEGVLDETTVAKYDHYVDYWHQAFRTIACVTSLAVEDYWRARLQKVQRNTVKKELSALRGFLTWCKENGHLEMVPVVTNPPKRATGKRCVTAKRRATQLDQGEVEKLLEALPEMSSGRGGPPFPVRDRFIVAWETALRPATLESLRAPDDYRRGAEVLILRDEVDKARFGRELPLTERARAALDRCCPDVGLVFGHHDYRHYLKAAAEKVLPPEKQGHFSAYDYRHARLTWLAERAGDNLPGLQYLAGHKHATTTARYLRPNQRAAERVLKAAEAIGPHSGRTDEAEEPPEPPKSLVPGAGLEPACLLRRGILSGPGGGGGPRLPRTSDRQPPTDLDGDDLLSGRRPNRLVVDGKCECGGMFELEVVLAGALEEGDAEEGGKTECPSCGRDYRLQLGMKRC